MEPLPATAAATRLSPAVRLEAEQRHIEDLDNSCYAQNADSCIFLSSQYAI